MDESNKLQPFSISRLETRLGIFRLSGQIISVSGKTKIIYRCAEFMGTDGWCELALDALPAQNILAEIKSEVLEHLS